MQAVAGQLLELFRDATPRECRCPNVGRCVRRFPTCLRSSGSSTSREIGSRSAVSAIDDFRRFRDEQGPCWVQALLRSWISVRFVYADTRSSSMESRWMNCMIDLSPNSFQIARKPLVSRGLLVSGADLNPHACINRH